ncbi:DUF2613 domain-containing protein [Nocardia asteroides]|uniref:DUF2613 domain-containing protein n=1 Tax=Nocardia asteroides TaxID=1824 RepID=UPI0033D10EB4
MIKKFVVGTVLTAATVLGGAGMAHAETTPYDSLAGPWPSSSACQRAAEQLNSNGKNPTTSCFQMEGRDGWWFYYAVVID